MRKSGNQGSKGFAVAAAIGLLAALAPAQSSLHLKVDGDGYFRFANQGKAIYASEAVLVWTSGVLASREGYPLLPQIHVPTTGTGVRCGLDGTITVAGKQTGRIVLVSFGGSSLGKTGAYFAAESSGSLGYPGEGVFGVITSERSSGQAIKQSSGPASRQSSNVAIQQSNNVRIEVHLHNEIEKSEILLGDIAEITGPDDLRSTLTSLDLGTTPIFGARRGISQPYILARVRSIGINPEKFEIACPLGAEVLRKGQKIEDEAFVEAAVKSAKEKLGITYDLRSDRSPNELWAPIGALSVEPREVISTGDGATVSLEVDVDGQIVGRRTVFLVPTTPLPRIGAGDPLKIRLLKNGAVVEVSGKARAGAKVGFTITVETEAGAVFTGTLKSTSVVEVQL